MNTKKHKKSFRRLKVSNLGQSLQPTKTFLVFLGVCLKCAIFLGEEKLIAPLIAIPNVDKANRRQEERRKTKLALCVIRMQNGNGKPHFCKLIG
jgi:hypothetical protein